MKDKLEKMYFSQSSLEIFNQCRLKFKKRYIDRLYWRNWVLGSEESIRTEKGRLFHLLAYRFFLNMDCEPGNITDEYKELQDWMRNLKSFVELNPVGLYHPEFELKMSADGLKLQAKYDLIVIEEGYRAIIYDWKVQDKPLNRKHLEGCFQTVVYRYMLAKAGRTVSGFDIQPENISMVYWQPNHPNMPVRIDYSSELFRQDEWFVKHEINKIMNCDFGSPAIKTTDPNICRHCEFCSICNGFQPEKDEFEFEDEDLDLSWDTEEELGF